jgi:hypothetical protein
MTTRIRFDPGKVVMTPGAMEAIASAGQKPSDFLLRHISGDWGDLDAHDTRANETAMKTGLRLLPSYKTATGEPLWVITEHVDPEHGGHPERRELTTILLPSDY